MEKITFENLPDTDTPINATNLNAIQTNVENAINSIIESGSNANGYWVKYSDGTMICWYRDTVTDQAIGTSYVNLYYGSRTITFPQEFYDTPTGICNQFLYTNSASWGAASGITKTQMTCRIYDVVSRSSGSNCTFSWQAIGRWKA